MPANPPWPLIPILLILASACAIWRPGDAARMNGRVMPRALRVADALRQDPWVARVVGVAGILGGGVALVLGWQGW